MRKLGFISDKLTLIGLLFMSLPLCICAQSKQNNWVLDGGIWLDFNSGAPVVQEPLEFSTIESAAVISDSIGKLMFYSNGIEVYNRNGEVFSSIEIDLDDTIFFKSFTQGALILPEIGYENLLRVIGIGTYSIVDMTMNGELGGMKESPSWRNFNSDILGFGEKNTAVRHANGRDWWILQMRHNFNMETYDYDSSMVVYLYDSNGINVYAQYFINTRTEGAKSQYGEISFSRDGSLLAMAFMGSITVYNFDRCSGQIGPEIAYIDTLDKIYSCAFSPSGKFLYFNQSTGFGNGENVLYQWNLELNQFGEHDLTKVYHMQGQANYANGQLEMGPDFKIYMSTPCRSLDCGLVSPFNTHLSVINHPDLGGLACDFDTLTVYLGGLTTNFGLPNMVNYALGALEGSECDTLGGGSTAVPESATLPPSWQITPTVSNGFYSFNGPEKAMLLVYDVWGRTVWQGTAAGLRIDLSAQPTGLYLVRAQWEEKQQTFRVMKQ